MNSTEDIRGLALHDAAQMRPAPQKDSDEWQQEWRKLESEMETLLQLIARAPDVHHAPVTGELPKDAWNWLKENPRTIRNAALQVEDNIKSMGELPRALSKPAVGLPRVLKTSQLLLAALGNEWSEENFAAYLSSFQQERPLQTREVWAMPAALKFAMLQILVPAAGRLLQRGAGEQDAENVPRLMRGLQALGVTSFPRLLEPLLPVESVLSRDAIYAAMDAPSRDRYRNAVAHLARRADYDELRIAIAAVELAEQRRDAPGPADSRMRARQSHVGYFLFAEGRDELMRVVGYNAHVEKRLRWFLQRNAADFYITGIWLLTLLLITLLMVPVLHYTDVLPGLAIAFVLTLIPASQSAIETMNHIVGALFPAEALPKLDFSRGIPEEHTTLVTVPTLLLNERQTRELVDHLEVRYLANKDPRLHFALATDLPDSTEEPAERDMSELVSLASKLIAELNNKYAGAGGGSFFLLHRHRTFNARQGVWMGWERKRGKLLDLNRLLRGQYDAFPVKQGPAPLLRQMRYVLTLDSDTDLPRGAAQKIIGTMAHPMNQAIIDPGLRIVTQGYGILQPRVGISVQSASRSRLARLYSGETGLDIYSRAVSDVYQDLFQEGIFTGKGLYEVDTLRAVLEHRFPDNALLSHDLIEGAYARVGLVSDVEVIDDYPSHLSAWSLRKHRWVRGDWQVTQWLFPRVPDEEGRKVANPISLLSRWKIFDNLRRSLVEPATFFLLAGGWLRLPGGPLYWTLATLLLLFLPIYIQLAASLFRAAVRPAPGALIDAMKGFYSSHLTTLLAIAFLPQQTLLSLDAIVRTIVRRVTGRRLLEWETAAEAEQGARKGTAVEFYLRNMPLISFALALLVIFVNFRSIVFAAPFLLAWAFSPAISYWLNRPPEREQPELRGRDIAFLRRLALLTWRYFAEFSTAEHHWLVPDSVEEKEMHVAARVSPTNLGLLLNSRQVAEQLGFLTVPQFVQLTDASLASLEAMQKFHGHLMNWYDTRTLEALHPRTISSVDNGNLLASLITLGEGCEAMLRQPLLAPSLLAGLQELEREARAGEGARTELKPRQQEMATSRSWAETLFAAASQDGPASETASWFETALQQQRAATLRLFHDYLPWLLPGFAKSVAQYEHQPLQLDALPEFVDELAPAIDLAMSYDANAPISIEIASFKSQLASAKARLLELIASLRLLAARARALANAMDFSLLLHPTRKLLSIAYNVEKDRIEDACYDLLASEARTAFFLAIAKGDVPQDTWFLLGRAHIFDHNQPLLVSWTGTMFEYLMPNLWMRSSRGSMMDKTQNGAVRAQELHVAHQRLPWGISEAGYATLGEDGHYQYHAFGVPALAVSPNATDGGPVIAPYATCLALPVDRRRALDNLYRMTKLGWLTGRGFYESADYAKRTAGGKPTLVRSWMAHHQGMTLLALLNVLRDDRVKQWFHADKRVQATQLLLQERPMKASALAAIRSSEGTARPERAAPKAA